MRSPDIKLVFASGLLVAAASVSGSGNPAENTLPPISTPTNAGSTDIENPYRLIPVPCKTKMPWEGVSQGQKSTAESVVVFSSIKIPEPKTTLGIDPECWTLQVEETPLARSPKLETGRETIERIPKPIVEFIPLAHGTPKVEEIPLANPLKTDSTKET